jgi:hypothetical protein
MHVKKQAHWWRWWRKNLQQWKIGVGNDDACCTLESIKEEAWQRRVEEGCT